MTFLSLEGTGTVSHACDTLASIVIAAEVPTSVLLPC